MIRKWNSLIADIEKGLLVWIEEQTSYNIPLNQSLIQNKALIILNSIKLAEVGSWGLRKEAISITKVQGEETASAALKPQQFIQKIQLR